jgi:hypothetical protein
VAQAVSRVLKHKLRNRMRTTVRTDEKRQGEYDALSPLHFFLFSSAFPFFFFFGLLWINVWCSLVSVVSCKRVGARVLNLILGQHPKVEHQPQFIFCDIV